jgi:hypothetical protein
VRFLESRCCRGPRSSNLTPASIVPILDQERQGWGSLCRGNAKVGPGPRSALNLDQNRLPTLPDLNIATRVNHSPHVVILGAGGSKAAFPRGDPMGRVVPVMQQLIECLDLTSSLKNAGFVGPTNFEAIYDELATTGSNPTLVNEIEGRVRKYFESMVLPTESTLYDRLILSMRETNLIATFNWDPFLPLAYARNAHIQRLPQLAFLHGNVEIAVCLKDRVTGFRWQQCPEMW